MRRLLLLQLCAAVPDVVAKLRYVRQPSIGQAWKLNQVDNHGGWDWPGQLDQATCVSSLPNGDLCVCDTRNHRVHIVPHACTNKSMTTECTPQHPADHPDFRMFGSFGFTPNHLYRPSGCASDGQRLYILDTYNHRLLKRNLSTGVLLRASSGQYGPGPGQLAFPQGLSMSDGLLYVADTRNHRVVTFNARLQYVSAFGRRGTGAGELSHPIGVAVWSARQEVYVADSGNDRIQVFSTRGKYIRSLGGEIDAQPSDTTFDLPSGVALAHGRVYVSEFHGKRVQVLTPFGQQLSVLKLEGVGSLSSIDADVAHDAIYVVDHDHHRVHVVAVRGTDRSSKQALHADNSTHDAGEWVPRRAPPHPGSGGKRKGKHKKKQKESKR